MKPPISNACRRAPLVAIAAAIMTGQLARADDWPFVRRDLVGSGVAESTLPAEIDVLWTYNAGEEQDAGFEATAVTSDGVIYIGDNAGTFHAVRLDDGTSVWSKTFEDASFLAGAAIDDRKLFVGDGNGAVRCLSTADGAEIWSATIDAEVYAGPTVVEGGVLVTCEAGTLVCFDAATGEKRWNFKIDAPLRCAPTTTAGRTFLAGCDSKLHVIDITSGKEVTTVDIDAPTGATAAVRGNRAYFGTEGGTFYAIELPTNDEGKPSVAWTYRDPQRGQPIRAAAALGDRLLVYGAQGKAVYALDRATGEFKWKFATRSRVDSSPVIAGDRVVAATDRGVFYVIDLATGEPTWQFDAGGSFTASPIVVDGRVVIGNGDGTLYCFGSTNQADGSTGGTENAENR